MMAQCGRKRQASWDDALPRGCFGAHDIAAALHTTIVDVDVVRRVIVPQLRSAQRTQGYIHLRMLVSVLAEAIEADGRLTSLLDSATVDNSILAPEFLHELPDQAGILCAYLSVDPWNFTNSASTAAVCQVGNWGVPPADLHEALLFHRGKVWSVARALEVACALKDGQNLGPFMNFSSPTKSRSKVRRLN